MNKEEIRLSNKITNNCNEISLNTIAYYQGEEYDLQDLLNGLLNQLQRKDNIINAIKEELISDNKFALFYTDENINTAMTLGAKYYREYILDKIKDIENGKQ